MAKKEVSQAAEKVAAAEKKKDKKPANPNGNIFVRAGKAIKKFCKDLKGEIKKIVWPGANTVLKSTGIVLLVVAVCAVVIFGVDQLLIFLLSLLNLRENPFASKEGAEAATEAVSQIAGMISFR